MPCHVTLKNDRPGKLLQDCLSTQLGHDLKIVCEDGVFLWSSVLISQWSGLTRKILREDYMPIIASNNVVLIMPEVKLTTMKLVLNWSVTGHIELENQNMVDEVISVLRCFGCCIQVSVESMNQELEASQTGSLTEPDVIEIEVEKKDVLEVDLTLEEDEKETKTNSSSPMISNDRVDDNESVLDDEDSDDFDADEVLDDFDADEVEHDRVSEKNMNASEVLQHLSCQDPIKHESEMDEEADTADSQHEINSVPSHTRFSLEYQSQNNSTSIVKNNKVAKGNPSNKFKCLLCGASNHSYLNLLCHLSVKHYKKELLDLFGSDDTCSICKKRMCQNNENKVIHVGTGHKQLLSLVPENVRAQLKDIIVQRQTTGRIPKMATWKRCKLLLLNKKCGWPCCRDFTNSPQDLSLHLASTHYKHKLVSAYGAVKLPCKQCPTDTQYLAKGRQDIVKHMVSFHPHLLCSLIHEEYGELLQSCLNDCYNCPICKETFIWFSLLRLHLCRNHFKNEIIKSGKFHRDCQVCKKLALKRNRGWTKCEIARHLGRTHSYLEQVLPDNIKEILNNMKKYKKNK